jgi:general secretion pathway protein A
VYLSFFGLSERPFSLSPDPRFFFMGASHQEALARIEEHGGGLVVLTGEAGTGKTSLLLALRERLDAAVAVTHVFNTTLPFDGMVEFMLDDLGIAKLEESPAMRLAALSGFLSEREQAGQSTTLIIDEAQNLDVPTLAQLGALASLDGGPPSKRLQILLVGSPDLAARLGHAHLRNLAAAIGTRCRLRPLDAREVERYIRGRLQIAGAHDGGLFSQRAIRRITQYSGGIPRVINTLCDHALLFAYADHTRRIDRHIVNHAIAYLNEGAQAPRRPVAVHDATTSESTSSIRAGQMLKIAGVALASALLGFALALLSGRD